MKSTQGFCDLGFFYLDRIQIFGALPFFCLRSASRTWSFSVCSYASSFGAQVWLSIQLTMENHCRPGQVTSPGYYYACRGTCVPPPFPIIL